MVSLSIGELAKNGGVSIDTIRYYEVLGILLPVERTKAGYRLYSESSLERLKFIRQAQRLDFTLKEIKELLDLRLSDTAKCSDVRKQAEAKIALIEEKEKELKTVKKALKDLIMACNNSGNNVLANECHFLDMIDSKGK
ncbi:MAG: heavy metal-responsive transcriptional regulator [Alphaproteobacteria bacterium]|nr:heavy metal-responsive transcriptional regulator [Alphaproteobacteria bacterium]